MFANSRYFMFRQKLALHVFLFFALLLSVLAAHSQKEVTEFGEFTAAEMNLKQCEFDKSADAVVLLDKANTYYNDSYNLITEREFA